MFLTIYFSVSNQLRGIKIGVDVDFCLYVGVRVREATLILCYPSFLNVPLKLSPSPLCCTPTPELANACTDSPSVTVATFLSVLGLLGLVCV